MIKHIENLRLNLIIVFLLLGSLSAQIGLELPELYKKHGFKGDYYTVLPPFKSWDHPGENKRKELSDFDAILARAHRAKIAHKRPFEADAWVIANLFFNNPAKFRHYYDMSEFWFYLVYPLNYVESYAHARFANFFIENIWSEGLEELQHYSPEVYKKTVLIVLERYKFWHLAPIYYIGFPLAIVFYLFLFSIIKCIGVLFISIVIAIFDLDY